LQEYTQRVNQQLPGQITAFYLEGSTALGEFNPRLSDVDFIAVLNHNISPDASNQLREIHQDIEKSHSQWKLSGMYFQSRRPWAPGSLPSTRFCITMMANWAGLTGLNLVQ
jgi:hypothetical protein